MAVHYAPRIVLNFCLQVSLFALAVVLAFAPVFAEENGKQTPFVKIVLAHFSTWDANHDGALGIDEINRLVKDPSIHGDDAAAVSALKLISRNTRTKLPPLTKDYFLQYNKAAINSLVNETSGDLVDATSAAASEEVANKAIESPARWDKYFIASKSRLAQAGHGQWSTSKFELTKIKQGPLGDCFFIASVGSVLTHRPEQIKSLIQQQSDGSYKAKFLNVPEFTVAKLTDSQIAMSSTSGDGAFLAVFEEAYGKYRNMLKGGDGSLEGSDALFRGGDSAPTLQSLTGHETKRIVFPRTVEARAAARDTVLPEVRKLLINNVQNHLAITGGGVVGVSARSLKKGAPAPKADGGGTLPIDPPDILRNHVYVIVDYDAKTDTVTIWNPHGQTFQPKGEPGMQNGYVTTDGKFTLPLTEAYQFFGSFTFETAAPVKAPPKKADMATR